jgi:hypothetical protein
LTGSVHPSPIATPSKTIPVSFKKDEFPRILVAKAGI